MHASSPAVSQPPTNNPHTAAYVVIIGMPHTDAIPTAALQALIASVHWVLLGVGVCVNRVKGLDFV